MSDMSMIKNSRILIVDDSEAIHKDFKEILAVNRQQARFSELEDELFGEPESESNDGTVAVGGQVQIEFMLDSAFQGKEGLEKVKEALAQNQPYAMAFVDVRMPPGIDGLQTMKLLWELDPRLQIVLCSAYSDYSWEEIRIETGQTDKLVILKKPFENMEVRQLASTMTEKWNVLDQMNHKMVELESEIKERKRVEEALRVSNERFHNAFENAPIGVCLVSPEGEFIQVNSELCKIFGYEKEELLNIRFTNLTHPEDIDISLKQVRALLEGVDDSSRIEKRYVRKDGKTIWAIMRTTLQRDLSDNPMYFITQILDITTRKKAEEEIRKFNEELEIRVEHRTAELKAVNKELEAFSYSVSHDLRAPLRSIDGFSQILIEDYSGNIDEDGHKYLERIRNNCGRMNQLIDDLLKLARITRTKVNRGKLNLGEIAQSVAYNLKIAAPDRDVRFEIEDVLWASCDGGLIFVVLENLIGNAFKYTGKNPEDKLPAVIEFGSVQKDNDLSFYVRDNGAGFDMAYADKLFGVFQRLHRKEEFEGTGVGLATVQRIVNLHGGRVWAESVVGEGATFYFTLGAQVNSSSNNPGEEQQNGNIMSERVNSPEN